MKFNCGSRYKPLTKKELAQLERWCEAGRVWLEKHKHLTRWHRWYAWYPVRVKDGDCRWLEWVERWIEYYDVPLVDPKFPIFNGNERERHYRSL